MRKWLSVRCVLAMLLGVLCVGGVGVVSAETNGDFKYAVSNGEATITGYSGAASVLLIPSTLDGYPVTAIGKNAFQYKRSLTGIVIANSITEIGESAFSGCWSLTTVSMPDGILAIRDRAFYNCYSLTEVVIPNSVSSIGASAFYNCGSIKNITIPDAVVSIGENAFYGCWSLAIVTIGSGADYIGKQAFSGCKSIVEFVVAENNPTYHSDGNCLVQTAEKTLIAGCQNSVIPDDSSVCVIEAGAFSGCASLKQITIPSSVTIIGASAFYACSSLQTIEIPDGVTSIQGSTFYNCDSLESISIPSSVVSIEYWTFIGCDNLQDVFYNGSKKQWAAVSMGTYNDDLIDATIHYNTIGNHWRLIAICTPATCTVSGRALFECNCGYEAERATPAAGHNYQTMKLVKPSCVENGYTLVECEQCNDVQQKDVIVGAHTFANNACTGCGNSVEKCLASAHKYANNTDQSWYVRQPGATSIALTFSADTETDDGFDFIYIYDGNDREVGKYTGKELAGATVTVTGEAARIRLTSDGDMTYYGFAVTNVSSEVAVPTLGDLTGDAELDMRDAFALYTAASGGAELTEEQMAAADMNGDGEYDMRDAFILYTQVSGG